MLMHALTAPFQKKSRHGVVLMYHRIANTLSDTWKLAVSPENFEEHLKILKNYHVVSTEELETILTKKQQITAKTILLTFDDGYRDNYLIAKSLLERYNIPAIFFIATNAIGKQEEFWWDALERICLLSGSLPSKLKLQQPENITLEIGSSTSGDVLSPLDSYFRLCEMARKMKAAQQQTFIKLLEDWAENAVARPEYFTMDKNELLDLQSNKLFTIGAHTLSHPFLPDVTYDDQVDEIQGSIAFLKNLGGLAPKYFAYPHGGRDQSTIDILSQSGISLGFTTEPQGFKDDTYQFAVPRFQVCNWDGKTFAFHLKHWLSSNKN